MKHLLVILLMSAPVFAMELGEAQTRLDQAQGEVKAAEQSIAQSREGAEATHQQLTSAAGKQEMNDAMAQGMHMLESKVKEHNGKHSALKAAHKRLQKELSEVGRVFVVTHDGERYVCQRPTKSAKPAPIIERRPMQATRTIVRRTTVS